MAKDNKCKACGHKKHSGKCGKEIIIDRGQWAYCECNGKIKKLSKSHFV